MARDGGPCALRAALGPLRAMPRVVSSSGHSEAARFPIGGVPGRFRGLTLAYFAGASVLAFAGFAALYALTSSGGSLPVAGAGLPAFA